MGPSCSCRGSQVRTSSLAARQSRPARRFRSPLRSRTGIRPSTPIPTRSTCAARSGTTRSAAGRTVAWARIWRGWRCARCWPNGTAGYPSTNWHLDSPRGSSGRRVSSDSTHCRSSFHPAELERIVQRLLTVASASHRHTDGVAARELQGWHPDPFRLHEMRYFSVGRPTKLVRDGRVEAYDEPPDDWSAAGAQITAIDGQLAAETRTELPATPLVGASMPPTAAGAMSATTLPTTAMPIQADPGAPTRFYPAVQSDQIVSPVAQSPYARPKRRRMEYAFVAAGAVVAVLVFVALGGGTGKGKPGISPAAFVTRAAQRTLAQNTADLTVTGTVTVGGQSVALGGNGQADLANNAMSLTVGGSMSNASITESEVLVGGNLYLNVSSNGRGLAAVTGGRHWIEMPIAQSGARGM